MGDAKEFERTRGLRADRGYRPRGCGRHGDSRKDDRELLTGAHTCEPSSPDSSEWGGGTPAAPPRPAPLVVRASGRRHSHRAAEAGTARRSLCLLQAWGFGPARGR
ncbi:MAG: hypothetical protein M3Y35_04830, partial [Actinomycetota bacterium]|nr:hypothetical protein [Actinomycetota bacterium]